MDDAASVGTVTNIFAKLSLEWNKTPQNLDECGRLLAALKVKLTQCPMSFLTTHVENDQKSIVLARGILEIGAQWAIEMKDTDAFERYMAQLKPYYMDYSYGDLEESTYKHQLLGLNLLRLLAQNKLADFHTELELLSTDDIQKNVYITHPVQIEQYLMEGSYNKVFRARENIPARSYEFFMKILLRTIRDEIARCIEKAYDKIGFHEAYRMLFFTEDIEAAYKDYIKERKWVCNPQDNTIYFQREEKVEEVVPAEALVRQTISYARELEMIV